MKFIEILGNSQKLDGGAMFGNAPREVWKTWLAPDNKNRITLACRALLIQTDEGQNILLEAGIGNFFDPKLKSRYGVVEKTHELIRNLKEKVGLNPEDIDVVILSHLHFDHAGGLLTSYDKEKESELVFKKAKYVVGKQQWERAINPHPRDRASFISELPKLLEDTENLYKVDGPKVKLKFLPQTLSFRFSNGHTPGLMMTEIKTLKGPLVFCADLVPGMPWVHVPISMGYDRYPELLIEEKRFLLNYLEKEKGALYFTHDPEIPCAKVTRNEKGKFVGEPMDLNEFNS